MYIVVCFTQVARINAPYTGTVTYTLNAHVRILQRLLVDISWRGRLYIFIKGNRKIQYGHKLNLSSGKSGLILDITIEEGNPTDIDRLLPMLDRHIDLHGVAPRQVAVDGGYASEANLVAAKALGVKDMAFNKKRGLNIEDMVQSHWVYRKLTRFRAGIEGNISCLKRVYGTGRCHWKGLEHFKSYLWSSVVSYNLTLMVRLKPG